MARKQTTSNPAELTDAAKAARRAYTNQYRRDHPDKVKQWNKSYWERRAQRLNDSPDEVESEED